MDDPRTLCFRRMAEENGWTIKEDDLEMDQKVKELQTEYDGKLSYAQALDKIANRGGMEVDSVQEMERFSANIIISCLGIGRNHLEKDF
jgi:hypothetical protein